MAAVKAHITRYRISAGYRYRVRITNRRLLKTAGRFNRAGFITRREAEAYARGIQPLIAQLEAGDVELGHTLSGRDVAYRQYKRPSRRSAVASHMHKFCNQ